MVDKLKLIALGVPKQVTFLFSIGKSYFDEITCVESQMDDCHIVFGQPWLLERNVVHDSYTNKYSFKWNRVKLILKPLPPNEVQEVTTKHDTPSCNEEASKAQDECSTPMAIDDLQSKVKDFASLFSPCNDVFYSHIEKNFGHHVNKHELIEKMDDVHDNVFSIVDHGDNKDASWVHVELKTSSDALYDSLGRKSSIDYYDIGNSEPRLRVMRNSLLLDAMFKDCDWLALGKGFHDDFNMFVDTWINWLSCVGKQHWLMFCSLCGLLDKRIKRAMKVLTLAWNEWLTWLISIYLLHSFIILVFDPGVINMEFHALFKVVDSSPHDELPSLRANSFEEGGNVVVTTRGGASVNGMTYVEEKNDIRQDFTVLQS